MARKEGEHQIGKYIFPSLTVDKMKKSIEKTNKTNKEHGFTLCVERNTNKIYNGPEHVGRDDISGRPTITFDSDCKGNQNHVGTFHTHLITGSFQASAMDILNNCQESNQIDCIGSSVAGKIVCMTKINPSLNCQDRVKQIVKKEGSLPEATKGDKFALYDELDKFIHENFKVTELK